MKNKERKVGIILGSKSDLPYFEKLFEFFRCEKIGYDFEIASCHRSYAKVDKIVKKWFGKKVIIAAAGFAAHLPGYIASRTEIPVIGVPVPTSDLKGLDSILSICQMPKGFAVLSSGVGSPGALNAGLFVKRILK
ncbi:MAG: AIR carboxylase family protein [Elusimicrobia bacterium]|nr:AIR carboxylase family protein [Elusimicrobiota bacterium]